MTKKILVVEDDDAIAAGLALNLRIEGYAAHIARDGELAWNAIRAGGIDLVLLDITLPKMSGLDVLAAMRQASDHTPVIVLSARQDEYDKVAALRLGADDYVTKPFALAEVLARVVAVLRRAGQSTPAPMPVPRQFGDVLVDTATRTVSRAGVDVKLTHLEFELLLYFLDHARAVISRSKLFREVWGLSHGGSPRTVDNFVAQLRAKLEADAERPSHFVTVRGSGYRFDP